MPVQLPEYKGQTDLPSPNWPTRIPKFRNLTVIYPRNEIDLAAFFHWRLSRLPMLVIDAAQQFWELCAKFGCFLDLQPVTNVRSSR